MSKAKDEKKVKADQARREAFAKMNAFISKTAKELDVTTSTEELTANRQGRNEAVATASMCADLIMGGGFPKNRMTVISGWEGTGKTTLMQSGMANQLLNGGMAHYGDFEGASDGGWISRGTGINLSHYEGNKKKEIPQTFYPLFDFQNGEDYFRYINRIMEESTNSGFSELPGLAHLFLLDSIAALSTEAEIEDDEAGDKPAVAILLSNWLRKTRGRFRRANAALVATNQIRQKIRLKYPNENPEYEPGGNAARFMADVRLWLYPYKAQHVDENPHTLCTELKDVLEPKADGLWIEHNPDGTNDRYVYRRLHTKKNRVYPALKTTYMRICTSKNGGEGTGIDKVFDTLHFFEELGRLEWVGGRGNKLTIKLDGKEFNYFDLKKEIETKPDLRDEALSLLDSGQAWNLYQDRLGGNIGKVSPELEAEEAAGKTEADVEE